MLEKLEQTKQRWGGQYPLVDNWLNERKGLLVSYCQLAGLMPFNQQKRQLPSSDEVQQFCQLLVDYVSSGHFEVYNKLLEACESADGKQADKARKVFPRLSEGASQALRFNDKYGEIASDDDLINLDQDLSVLGEWLELHLSLEDRLLSTAHQHFAHIQGQSAESA